MRRFARIGVRALRPPWPPPSRAGSCRRALGVGASSRGGLSPPPAGLTVVGDGVFLLFWGFFLCARQAPPPPARALEDLRWEWGKAAGGYRPASSPGS